jgi:hypothetical protein
MVSLEDGTVTGIDIGGNSTLNLNCGMVTNSRSAQAVTAFGSSSVTATPIGAVGGISTSSNFVAPTTLLPYLGKQADPLSALAAPSLPPGNCNVAIVVQPNTTAPEAEPGCYSKMDVKGTLNLKPGTYYIDAGDFIAGSQSVITGTDVTIVLTSRTAANNPSSIGTLDISAGATIKLDASETGPFPGVLFYQDRRAPLLNAARLNGNALSSIEGAIYLPRANLTMNGTSGMNTKCLQLVARRLNFTGNSAIQNECAPTGAAQAFKAKFVRLVA